MWTTLVASPTLRRHATICDDSVAQSMYIPAKEIFIQFTGSQEIYFDVMPAGQIRTFSPLREQRDKADKTLYGFVNSFMQIFQE